MSQAAAGYRASAHCGVERPETVVAPVDEHVVAPTRIHGKPRLDRVPPVVTLDQVVDLVEAPGLHGGAPRPREPLGGHLRREPVARSPSSARSWAAVIASISRRRTMYGSGPPSDAR